MATRPRFLMEVRTDLVLTEPKRSASLSMMGGKPTYKVYVEGYWGVLESESLGKDQYWAATAYTGHNAVYAGFDKDLLMCATKLANYQDERNKG